MKYKYEKINDKGEVIDRITCDNPMELIKSIFQYEKLLYELKKKK